MRLGKLLLHHCIDSAVNHLPEPPPLSLGIEIPRATVYNGIPSPR